MKQFFKDRVDRMKLIFCFVVLYPSEFSVAFQDFFYAIKLAHRNYMDFCFSEYYQYVESQKRSGF